MAATLFTILLFASLGLVLSAIGAVMGRNDVVKRRRWNQRMLLSSAAAIVVLAVLLIGPR